MVFEMLLPLVEVIGWALWEFILAIIFFNTGSVLIRLISLNKVKYPLIPLGIFKLNKPHLENTFLCYFAGVIFYMCLAVILLIIFN